MSGVTIYNEKQPISGLSDVQELICAHEWPSSTNVLSEEKDTYRKYLILYFEFMLGSYLQIQFYSNDFMCCKGV
jgi:hypothetical protein